MPSRHLLTRPPLLLALGLCLAACGTPSVGVGYGIPGTPLSVGTSVPLGRGGAPSKKFTYRALQVESIPDGAQVFVNEQLIGSTPLNAQIPFEKGFWGGAKGSTQLLVKKPGYLPEGERLFPAGDGRVAREPDGAPIGTLRIHLRDGEAATSATSTPRR